MRLEIHRDKCKTCGQSLPEEVVFHFTQEEALRLFQVAGAIGGSDKKVRKVLSKIYKMLDEKFSWFSKGKDMGVLIGNIDTFKIPDLNE